MTVHRVQGVGFERVAVWIPSRGFFAQSQGYTAVSRGKPLDSLFLVLPDEVLKVRASAKEFLKEAFQARHRYAVSKHETKYVTQHERACS